jgi:hypothetical protein
MAFIKHVQANTAFSFYYVNSFDNKVNFTIPAEGMEIDLTESTNLSQIVNKYIMHGILKEIKAPVAAKKVIKDVNPFDKTSKKVETEIKTESKIESKLEAIKTTDESDASNSRSSETSNKKPGRPSAKKAK